MSDNNYHLSKEQQPTRPTQLLNTAYTQDYHDIFVFNNPSTASPSTISSPVSPMATYMYQQQNLIGASNFDLGFSNYYYDVPQQQPWTLPQQTTSYTASNSVLDCLFEPPFPQEQQQQQNTVDLNAVLFPQTENIPMDGTPMYFDSTPPPPPKTQKKYKKKTQKYRYSNFTSASLSPNERPISSPLLSNNRKRRASTTASWQPTMSTFRPPADSPRSKKIKIDNTISETVTDSPTTVDQMENELSFLNDDCATILIMLDSLRNAFSTSNKMDDKRRPKNQEMEREMRIAYDDLMLQVRQLERKVERLEEKSKTMNK